MSRHGARPRCPAARLPAVAAALASLLPASAALARPQAVAPAPTGDADCLAQAIYYEARGEPLEGRRAVAEVVLNRLHSALYPKTVCAVVFQGAGRATGCQFTFACDGSRAVLPQAKAWRDAEALAADALAGRAPSVVGASTHYHATWMRPAWSLAMTPTLQIGAHRFYVAGGADRRMGAAPALVEAVAAATAAFSVWGLQVALVSPPGGAVGRTP